MMKKVFQQIKALLLNREVLLYLIFGVLTTVVNYAVFVFFREMIVLPLLMANAIAWVIAVLFAFATNKKYVFESNSGNIIKEILLFFAARFLSFLLFDQLSLYAMVMWLGIHEYIAKLIANVFVVIFNYVASKIVIFKK